MDPVIRRTSSELNTYSTSTEAFYRTPRPPHESNKKPQPAVLAGPSPTRHAAKVLTGDQIVRKTEGSPVAASSPSASDSQTSYPRTSQRLTEQFLPSASSNLPLYSPTTPFPHRLANAANPEPTSNITGQWSARGFEAKEGKTRFFLRRSQSTPLDEAHHHEVLEVGATVPTSTNIRPHQSVQQHSRSSTVPPLHPPLSAIGRASTTLPKRLPRKEVMGRINGEEVSRIRQLQRKYSVPLEQQRGMAEAEYMPLAQHKDTPKHNGRNPPRRFLHYDPGPAKRPLGGMASSKSNDAIGEIYSGSYSNTQGFSGSGSTSNIKQEATHEAPLRDSRVKVTSERNVGECLTLKVTSQDQQEIPRKDSKQLPTRSAERELETSRAVSPPSRPYVMSRRATELPRTGPPTPPPKPTVPIIIHSSLPAIRQRTRNTRKWTRAWSTFYEAVRFIPDFAYDFGDEEEEGSGGSEIEKIGYLGRDGSARDGQAGDGRHGTRQNIAAALVVFNVR